MSFVQANGAVALSGALTATTNSPALRLPAGASGGHCLVAVHVSAVSGTSPSLTCKLQQSDSASSGFADVTGAAGSAITAAGNQLFNGHVTKPFVRVVGTVSGTTPSLTTTVTVFGAAASAS
jgi:hypothetical protein